MKRQRCHSCRAGSRMKRLMLVLEDDGCGLPPGSNLQGFGLTGMLAR